MARRNLADGDTEPQGVLNAILKQASPPAQMNRARKAPASFSGKGAEHGQLGCGWATEAQQSSPCTASLAAAAVLVVSTMTIHPRSTP